MSSRSQAKGDLARFTWSFTCVASGSMLLSVGAGMFQRRLKSLESSRKFFPSRSVFPNQTMVSSAKSEPLGSLLGFD
jgi:hypothetical protein